MSLFHKISFKPIDPYGDVQDEILAEQMEPQAISLEEDINEAELEQRWEEITREARADQDALS